MENIIENGQITQLPPCGTPNCTSINPIRIFYGGAFRCGDCVNKHVLAGREQQLEQMQIVKNNFYKEMEKLK